MASKRKQRKPNKKPATRKRSGLSSLPKRNKKRQPRNAKGRFLSKADAEFAKNEKEQRKLDKALPFHSPIQERLRRTKAKGKKKLKPEWKKKRGSNTQKTQYKEFTKLVFRVTASPDRAIDEARDFIIENATPDSKVWVNMQVGRKWFGSKVGDRSDANVYLLKDGWYYTKKAGLQTRDEIERITIEVVIITPKRRV